MVTAQRENIAAQSTVMQTIAKEPIYLPEPKRVPQLQRVNPEQRVRVPHEAKDKVRKAASPLAKSLHERVSVLARRDMVRPLRTKRTRCLYQNTMPLAPMTLRVSPVTRPDNL